MILTTPCLLVSLAVIQPYIIVLHGFQAPLVLPLPKSRNAVGHSGRQRSVPLMAVHQKRKSILGGTKVVVPMEIDDHSPVVPQQENDHTNNNNNNNYSSSSSTVLSSAAYQQQGRELSVVTTTAGDNNNICVKPVTADAMTVEKKVTIDDPTKKMMQQIKDAGMAGVISYALWELGFWTVSIPLTIVGYQQVTGHWPDLHNSDDVAKLSAEAFAFVNFARFAVPLRIGLALSTTPWIQTNIVDKFIKKDEAMTSGASKTSDTDA